jgi:replication factor A1
MEKELTKVKDLTIETKQANVVAKVLSMGERKEVPSKFGGTRHLAEAVVGDETGTVILTLWEDQIGLVNKDDTVYLENGFVSLVRGHMRLNCGKYGTLSKSDKAVAEVNTANDMSAVEYQQERRRYDSGGGRYGGGGGGYGGYGGDFGGGRRDRKDFSRDRSKDRRGGRGRGRY